MNIKDVIDGKEFRTQLANLMPNYSMGMDNDGHIIIYTNLTDAPYDDYVEMD